MIRIGRLRRSSLHLRSVARSLGGGECVHSDPQGRVDNPQVTRQAEEKEPWCDLPQMGDVVLSLNASTRVHVEILNRVWISV